MMASLTQSSRKIDQPRYEQRLQIRPSPFLVR